MGEWTNADILIGSLILLSLALNGLLTVLIIRGRRKFISDYERALKLRQKRASHD